MVAISTQYRTRGSHGTTTRECVADGKAAVRWIREHAAELGVDPDRIAAGGGSAGGHVAAATGVINGLEGKGENTAVRPKPNALLLFNPVTDLSGRSGRWGEDPELGSPLQHVDAKDPPAILFHGKADRTVPFAAAEAFCDAMRAVGNRCELVGYEGPAARLFQLWTQPCLVHQHRLAHGPLSGFPPIRRGRADGWPAG